jgi:alpha-L-rhamnosidase
VTEAFALLAVSDCVTLHVNGRAVTLPDAAPAAPIVVDIAAHCQLGTNLISLIATHSTDGQPAGITGKVVIRTAAQGQIVLPLDASWQVSRSVEDPASVAKDAVPAAVLATVGLTDPIGNPLTPWGVPGNADGLVLPPACAFRHEFNLDGDASEAVLHLSALGISEVRLNGQPVGSDWFTPGWSDYRHRVYTVSHEVKGLLRAGRNVLTAILAEGWHSGYLGWSRQRNRYEGEPALRVQLDIRTDRGAAVRVVTDRSWRVSRNGPVREADILMGEHHDARREWPGWESPGFEHGDFVPVLLREVPPIAVECYPGDPVAATEELPWRHCTEPRPGVYILDFGQNFAGVARITAEGPAGTRLRLRFAEVLTEAGELYTEALRGARAEDTYIKATDAPEVWTPRFTFHGFRYMSIEGLPTPPRPETAVGIVLHNPMERVGELTTSDMMVNRLVENIRWSQRSNFLEVPTDCPQRDERLGWTGDAQIFIGTAARQYDIGAFFTKWLRDLFDAQYEEGWFCPVAPRVSVWPSPEVCAAAWADAAIICPWTMLRLYGDRRIVRRYWDGMVRYMDYLESTSDGLIRPAEGFGDWVSLNAHTPLDVVATAYFAQNARMMADMAAAIGLGDEAAKYSKLYDRIRAAFQARYIEPDGAVRGRTQSSHVLALRFGLLPEKGRDAALGLLLQDLAYRHGHFSTGFVGLKDLMPTLSDGGRHDMAVRILLNNEFPSWGYQIRHGATTIWERWDGWSEEMGLQTPHMNSFNHYSFGAVGDWMFSHLAGIEALADGYTRLRIAPRVDRRLPVVRARQRTPMGWVVVEVLLARDGRGLRMRCRVPVGASAEIVLPCSDAAQLRESGLAASTGWRVTAAEPGRVVIDAGSGHYDFTMPCLF